MHSCVTSLQRRQTIPVYARWVDNGFELRPLLFPFDSAPKVSGREVDKLLEDLARRLFFLQKKEKQSDYDLQSAAYQKFFWAPRCHLESLDLSFSTGAHRIKGLFNVVWFDQQGQRYVILPEFEHRWFIATPEKTGKYRLAEQVIGVIQSHFRAVRQSLRSGREEHGRKETLTFEDISRYQSTGNDFLAEVEQFMDAPQRLPQVHAEETVGKAGLRGSGLSQGSLYTIGENEIDEVGEAIGQFDESRSFPTMGREGLIEALVARLQDEQSNALVLLGPLGAGRTTVLQAAHKAYRSSLPAHRRPRYIWRLDPVRIIAGKSIIGEWQQAFSGIIHYVQERCNRYRSVVGPDWLFFDNPVALLRVGRSAGSSLTLASMLKVHLDKGNLDVVLEATPEEWQRMQEIDRSFTDLFEVVRVPTLTGDTLGLAVTDMRRRLERDHLCELDNEALFALMQLHGHRFRNVAQPGRLAPVMKRLAVRHGRRRRIGRAEVMDDFASVTRMNHSLFDTQAALDGEQLRNEIGSRLIGQKAALETLAETVELIKAGLHDPGKPIASYLFIGPTGVGKTEAVKALARQLFGDAGAMIRFNMNEYADAGAPRRLIGDFEQPQGQLTAQVRYQPFCILLLDEIEKAHPLVHDLLLQVMGEGRLTDALGRVTDFTNTIIFMTSNLGAQQAARHMGFVETDNSRVQTYREAAERYFRPEFFNRIDRMVDFHPLEPEHIAQIAQLLIDGMFKRQGLVRRGAMLRVPGRVVRSLAERGFDAAMGGRALRRLIEREMTVMLAGPLAALPGNQRVVVELLMAGDKLFPRVTPLNFATAASLEPMPTAPSGPAGEEMRQLFEDFQAMLEICSSIRGGRLPLDETEAVDGKLLGIIETEEVLQEKKQLADEIMDELDWKATHAPPAQLFKLRRWPPPRWDSGLVGSQEIRDRFIQLDIRDFINEAYGHAEIVGGSRNDQYLDLTIARRIIALQLSAWIRNEFDTVLIDYMSWIDGQGEAEIKFLRDWHCRVFLQQGCELLAEESRHDRHLAVWRGPALMQMFLSEQGIHLFSRSFRSDLQVQLQLMPLAVEDDPVAILQQESSRYEQAMADLASGRIGFDKVPAITGEVLRLYADHSGVEDGKVHDLRTGLIYKRSDMDALAWRHLLASALPDEDLPAADDGGKDA